MLNSDKTIFVGLKQLKTYCNVIVHLVDSLKFHQTQHPVILNTIGVNIHNRYMGCK